MAKKHILSIILISISLLLASCTKSTVIPKDKLQIMVSILPQKYFIDQIGGKLVNVNVMIPAGYSPEIYEPTPLQIKRLIDTDIYFAIGNIDFERTNLEKFKSINPKMKIINTTDPNDSIKFKEGGIDPHVWLSPKLVIKQARIISQNLSLSDSKHLDIYKNNLNIFVDKLNVLDENLKKKFATIRGKSVLLYHPVLGYLANEYGFEQKYIEIDGKTPNINEMQSTISQALHNKVQYIYIEKQFDSHSARVIADQIEAQVLEIDPLAENYFMNINDIAKKLTQH